MNVPVEVVAERLAWLMGVHPSIVHVNDDETITVSSEVARRLADHISGEVSFPTAEPQRPLRKWWNEHRCRRAHRGGGTNVVTWTWKIGMVTVSVSRCGWCDGLTHTGSHR